MSQIYLRRGSIFIATNDEKTDVHQELPVGVYRINFDPNIGWYFDPIESFSMPPKLYGNIEGQAERVLKTYRTRLSRGGKSTGVLLSGTKGSGKTLLAKKVAMDSNLPVIVVNTPFFDDDFKETLANVGECVIIFDEFEKVYAEKPRQNQMLTLFDGVFDVRALMFLIVNESGYLVSPLLNRPGRLYYSFEYKGLKRDFIEDYCKDNLNNIVRRAIAEEEFLKGLKELREKATIVYDENLFGPPTR